MPTQEERLNTLERSVALLEKRFNDADIQSVNHNATMLLGLAYKQQSDIKEIKINLITMDQQISEIRQDIKELRTSSSEQTTLLTQILQRLPENGK